MPQAVVDPEELRQFARLLKKFNGELRERMSALNNQLASLGTSWRDQEHQKFVAQFEENLRVMQRFADASDRHVPYLLRKAEHIEQYLQS
jgi:WXG100 family type VII secretion target